jgi:hypothetical protein
MQNFTEKEERIHTSSSRSYLSSLFKKSPSLACSTSDPPAMKWTTALPEESWSRVARALAATVGYNVFGLSAMRILRFFVTAAYFI